MSKNKLPTIEDADFIWAIEKITHGYNEYKNGLHLTPDEFDDLVKALKELKRLPVLIERQVGVM